MARKTKTWVADNGRDSGKHFMITEMSAYHGEKWAMRVMSALARSGIPVPQEAMTAGLEGLAYFGLRSFLAVEFDDAEPLLDEMMQCVQIVPDPRNPSVLRPVDEEDVEEVATILALRSEVFALHTGFSLADWMSNLMGRLQSAKEAASDMPNTSTSQPE